MIINMAILIHFTNVLLTNYNFILFLVIFIKSVGAGGFLVQKHVIKKIL